MPTTLKRSNSLTKLFCIYLEDSFFSIQTFLRFTTYIGEIKNEYTHKNIFLAKPLTAQVLYGAVVKR